jgi:hypothetical protein
MMKYPAENKLLASLQAMARKPYLLYAYGRSPQE